MNHDLLIQPNEKCSPNDIQSLFDLPEKPTFDDLCEIADYLSVRRFHKLDKRIRYKIFALVENEPEQCGVILWAEQIFSWLQIRWFLRGEPAQESIQLCEDNAIHHIREFRDHGYIIIMTACATCCQVDRSANLMSRVLGETLSHGFCPKHAPEIESAP